MLLVGPVSPMVRLDGIGLQTGLQCIAQGLCFGAGDPHREQLVTVGYSLMYVAAAQ
jgi:hypothetical protein